MSQKKQKINPGHTKSEKLQDKPSIEDKNPAQRGRTARILLAPLDWGLGHATRCIPIIRELILQGAEVWIAAEGAQEKLLRLEFPHLSFLRLPGYRIQYAASRSGVIKKIITQTPKILKAIRQEHIWLKKMVEEHHFDAVISDNRYGLYHSTIPCVFITHQLRIKSPWGKWSENLLQRRNYHYVNRFTECWVPDVAGENNLAGELSHPALLPDVPVKYIGWLSRFEKKPTQEITGHLLVLLSGPEPQRSIFENIIIRGIAAYEGSATIVRGLPGDVASVPSAGSIRIYNHLSAAALNEEMLKAEWIISRSGYSTVMEVATLQKKSILVPTPGQTEQEYLAGYYMENEFALAALQQFFFLPAEIEKAKFFPYRFVVSEAETSLRKTIETLLSKIC